MKKKKKRSFCLAAICVKLSRPDEIFSTCRDRSSSTSGLLKSQSQRQLGQSNKLYCNAKPGKLSECPCCLGSRHILKVDTTEAEWIDKLSWDLVVVVVGGVFGSEGMEFQGYSGQTPIIFPQLLQSDRKALYKSGDCRSIYAVRVNRKLKASLWISTPNYRDRITETSILSLPTKDVTRVSHASWCALEWDSAPLSTCRSGDYIQGFRRGKEAAIWNCCVLLLCTFLNAALSCSMHRYCMTVAWGSSAGGTIFVWPDERCTMFYSSIFTVYSFQLLPYKQR